MCFEITGNDKHLTVQLTGIISVNEATSIRQSLFPRIQKGFISIRFDMGEVKGIDSSGLGLLLAVQKLAIDINGDVTFTNVHEQLQERLILAGITL